MNEDGRQPAVLFDRDGTLASVAWCAPVDRRSSEQWRRFNALCPLDPVVPEVAALWRSVRPGVAKLVVSGRTGGDFPGDRAREHQLRRWLREHGLEPDLFLCRAGGDYRRDTVLKRELYERWVEPHYDVRVAVDDRPEVCDLWEELGVGCAVRVRDPGVWPPLVSSEEATRAGLLRDEG